MRFLADESCDFAVIRALRAAGHDVVSVVEVARGAKDSQVLHLARAAGRVLLTEDKDFGQLMQAQRPGGPGVILVRFPAAVRSHAPAELLALLATYEEQIARSFIVLEPGRARIGRT